MDVFKKIVSFFADILQTIVVAGSIFAVVYLFLAQPHQVTGDSMFPNFKNKEYVLTDKLTYRFREPERLEVVVFKAPDDPEKDYIKRIITKPGERVKIEGEKVFVNNLLFDERAYLRDDILTQAGQFAKEGVEHIVEKGSYFVLGDNRPHSADSRKWGLIKKNSIVGRSLFVYWPPQAFRIIEIPKYKLSD